MVPQSLAPTYEQLADSFSHAKSRVIIAKVDADGDGKPLGQEYGVTGYPSTSLLPTDPFIDPHKPPKALKWIDANGKVEPYDGQRDIDALAGFVTAQSGVRSNIKPPPPPAFKILTSTDFDAVALDPSKDVLVTFTAPWCGHCKTMKPEYEKAAADFAAESNCVVANVDADAEQNAALKTRYGVTGFPTIKFFGKDSKEEPETYSGGRTESDFVKYLNSKCGTFRAVGGGLTEEAGRLPDFDTLASKFYGAAADARSAVYDEAVALAATAGSTAQQYLKVMQKVVNGSEEYIVKESNRCVWLPIGLP